MTENETKPRQMGPEDLLNLRDVTWAPRLEQVSLVAETLDEGRSDVIEQALTWLGYIYRERATSAGERFRVMRGWPAVHLMTTTWVAAQHWDGGLWPHLSEWLGVEDTPEFHQEWGESFLANLRRLGLPTFDTYANQAGQKYVGRILLHSGLPNANLAEYFRLLDQRRRQVPGIEPPELVSWADSSAGRLRLRNQPVVKRFLGFGQEFAVDVTDRSFELLDDLRSGGDGSQILLPQRFVERARGVVDDAPGAAPESGRVTSLDHRPGLRIDPFGTGLQLRLPPVGAAPDGTATWLVSLGDEDLSVSTEPLFPGSADPAPETRVVVRRPVRLASAALSHRPDLQFTTGVVDDEAPLMAFDEGLALVPGHLPLPPEPTWLLFPGDLAQLSSDRELEVRSVSPVPPGWHGWSLVLLDLTDAAGSALSLGDKTREVRSRRTARVETDDAIGGVRSNAGDPVYASPPRVRLPDDLQSASWTVTVLDFEGEEIARWSTSEDDTGGPGPASVWDRVARPLCGTYTVRVQGPWGRGTKRRVAIVEGLTATITPPYRTMERGGLQNATVVLSSTPTVDLSSSRIDLAPHQREHRVRARRSGGAWMALMVRPPHMSVAFTAESSSRPSSIRPIALTREDVLDDPGTLLLDIGDEAEPTLFLVRDGQPLMEMRPGAGRGGSYPFDLSKIVDTLSLHPLTSLALTPDGGLAIATVRPGRLFDEARVENDQLILTGAVDAPGLTAYLFFATAPWRPPLKVAVMQGIGNLPSQGVHAGSFKMLLRIEDPWAPEPAPVWPERGESTWVQNDGWLNSDDRSEVELARFLAGDRDELPAASDLSHLWAIRERIAGLGLGDREHATKTSIDEAIVKDPRAALSSLIEQGGTRNAAWLLIDTGLVWADLRSAHQPEPPTWTTASALPAALLCSADADWSDAELESAIEVCGPEVTALLAGRDPAPSVGQMDVNTEAYVEAAPASQQAMVGGLGLVPQGLLSTDSRTLAVIAALDRRRDSLLGDVARSAHKILPQVEQAVRSLGDKRSVEALDKRRHPHVTGGWRALTTISLGYAIVARHAMRGNARARAWLATQQRWWSNLARVCPELCTTDLLLAEFIVASSQVPSAPTDRE